MREVTAAVQKKDFKDFGSIPKADMFHVLPVRLKQRVRNRSLSEGLAAQEVAIVGSAYTGEATELKEDANTVSKRPYGEARVNDEDDGNAITIITQGEEKRVTPREGTWRTKKRNNRHRNTRRLKQLKSQGILPSNARLRTLRTYEDIVREGENDVEAAILFNNDNMFGHQKAIIKKDENRNEEHSSLKFHNRNVQRLTESEKESKDGVNEKCTTDHCHDNEWTNKEDEDEPMTTEIDDTCYNISQHVHARPNSRTTKIAKSEESVELNKPIPDPAKAKESRTKSRNRRHKRSKKLKRDLKKLKDYGIVDGSATLATLSKWYIQ